MEEIKNYTLDLHGKKLEVEVGRVANLANGSCVLTLGETLILATASASKEPTAGVQKFKDLNDQAIAFIKKIEELSGAPVVMISTGPRREDAIIREYPLKK